MSTQSAPAPLAHQEDLFRQVETCVVCGAPIYAYDIPASDAVVGKAEPNICSVPCLLSFAATR